MVERYKNNFMDVRMPDEVMTNEYVNQKYYSHRFHFGMDYFLNEKNQFNVYGFLNPYAQENDGRMETAVYKEDWDDRCCA